MVAMNVWPTDAADGSVSSEARWRKMARLWAPSGVAAGIGAEMAPTLAYPNLTVKNGAAWVDGAYCELPGDQVLAVTANGLAVVRFDPAANTAQLLYRDAVSVPAQDPNGTWELPIAKIVGSALVDARTVVRADGSKAFASVASLNLWTTAPIGTQAYVTGIPAPFTWNGTTWVVPPGTVLNTSTVKAEAMVTASGSYDVSHAETAIYPFPTVATIDITGIYVVPDRATNVGAMVFSNGYQNPLGGGRIYDYQLANTATTGATWWPLPSLRGQQPVATNVAGIVWVVRLTTTPGGPTQFGYSYNVTIQRTAA